MCRISRRSTKRSGSQLEKDALYANYIDRQKRDVEALKRDETYQVPANFDFASIEGLSNELKQKLAHARRRRSLKRRKSMG